MRLAEHRLHVYHLRYARPVRWSDIVEEAAPFVLLKLTSDTGDVASPRSRSSRPGAE
jgi:L-Ala-D/L-Glu epimerase / N-acetyl-D-glutamate racemase